MNANQNEIDAINKIRLGLLKGYAGSGGEAQDKQDAESDIQALIEERAKQSAKPIAQPTEYYIPVQAHVLYRAALREYLNAGRTFDDADFLAIQDIQEMAFLQDPDSNILDYLEY